MRVYTESYNKAKMISSVRKVYGSDNQRARALAHTVIKPHTESIIQAYIPLPLASSPEFLIDSQSLRNDIFIGKGLYRNDMFHSFPIRICNLGSGEQTIRKGQKLAIISPVGDLRPGSA